MKLKACPDCGATSNLDDLVLHDPSCAASNDIVETFHKNTRPAVQKTVRRNIRRNVQRRAGGGGRTSRSVRVIDDVWDRYKIFAEQDDVSLSFVLTELLAVYGDGQVTPTHLDAPRRKRGDPKTEAHSLNVLDDVWNVAQARAERDNVNMHSVMAGLVQDFADGELTLPKVQRVYS
jgi:hypothetical protein